MKTKPLDIVILGLSITSSWGNGHATTYRALARALHARGHRVLFLERDVAWYADNRDLVTPKFARTELYMNLSELRRRFSFAVRGADLVVVGSYVPEGIEVGRWVTRIARGITAFYDIDTPVTVASLERGEATYVSRELIRRYDMYLSFTGGPMLDRIAERYGARQAWPLHCSVDPDEYYPEPRDSRWDLGYMGTYSDDRQPMLDRLMLAAARSWRRGRFIVAGPQYPERTRWPRNVDRITHLPPAQHRAFYNGQRFTLNITRGDMVAAGYSPSVRLFEAAACATPIITDMWSGLESFFQPGVDLIVSTSVSETLHTLLEMPEPERLRMGAQARARVLASHTAAHRAAELERYVREVSAGAAQLESVPSGGTWLKG